MLRSVIVVTNIMEDDFITVKLSPRSLDHIGLPWLLVVRPKGQPPGGNEEKKSNRTNLGAPARPDKSEAQEGTDNEDQRQSMPPVGDGKIKPERAKSPGEAAEKKDPA